jgi:hypothetical protein
VNEPYERDRSTLLWELYRSLEQRSYATTSHGNDDLIVATMRGLGDAIARPTRTSYRGFPPRGASTAMAMAVYAQPHLSTTLVGPRTSTTQLDEPPPRVADLPPLPSTEQLERALGLPAWELDDLREEVDQVAGMVLKQQRALNWMWTHFRLDAPQADTRSLLRILHPGAAASSRGQVAIARRGSQLYILIPHGAARTPSSLYLSWLAESKPVIPRFESRYVDQGLVRSLTRSIGASDQEIRSTLDQMVTVIPWAKAETFLVHDQWRSRGHASLTRLGWPYSGVKPLHDQLSADGAHWRQWLTVNEGKLRLRSKATSIFDRLAVDRLRCMLHETYAEILARVDAEHRTRQPGPAADELPIYNTSRHLRKVLGPLLHWVNSAKTHDFVASATAVKLASVEETFAELARSWSQHAEDSWFAPPQGDRLSIQVVLLEHLVALQHSLRALAHRSTDNRYFHWDTLLLFAGIYLREAPIERLWSRRPTSEDSTSNQADAAAPDWFWGSWTRILDQVEEHNTANY